MTIMGIDGSTTCSGYSVFIDGKLVDYGAIKPKSKLDWRSRIMDEFLEFMQIIKKYRPSIIVMEDVPKKKGSDTLVKLGAVQGMMLSLCAGYGIEAHFILPQVWRREIGLYDGTRDGLKRDVMKKKAIETANQQFDLSLKNDDTAEAILIAYSKIKLDNSQKV